MQALGTVSPWEEKLGLKYYLTEGKGIGGKIRVVPEDFVVEEITSEGLFVNDDLVNLSRGDGNHSLGVLSKTSKDTIPTARQVGAALGTQVTYAGIKDRRARTHQLVSMPIPLSQGLLDLGIPRVSVRVIGRSRWPLKAGELRGNRFRIIIRHLREKPLRQNIEWLPGYYGHQRFGTTRPNTHLIGRLIVKKEYEAAVWELVAEPYPNEPQNVRSARAELKSTGDIRGALKSFPASLTFERIVLGRLLESPHDPLAALRALPPNMLRLYVNAYQSYLFNQALSKRWNTYGLDRVEKGDYASPLDRWLSPARPIKATDDNLETLRRLVSSGKGVPMLRVVGAKTALEGIDREVYFELMEAEGVTLNYFEEVAGSPFFGSMRFAMFKPIDFSVAEALPDETLPGTWRQEITMSLPKGCYATVVLREMMRPEDPFQSGF